MGFSSSSREVAEEVSNLQYDALTDFLRLLAAKFDADATEDDERGICKGGDLALAEGPPRQRLLGALEAAL